MANARPAMTTPQVSVTYFKTKTIGGKTGATMKTHYNQTLKQADRAGVIRLNDEGKIAHVGPDVTINLPASLYKEDVYELGLLKDMADLSG